MVYRNFAIKVTDKKHFRSYYFRDCWKNNLDVLLKPWGKGLIFPKS